MEALRALIDRLEQDLSLQQPERLRERIDALDRLERYLGSPANSGADSVLDARLRSRVESLCAGLEAANQRLYAAIRHEIRRDAGAAAMQAWAPAFERTPETDGDGYDYLDALLTGVLQLEEPASEPAELSADMVFYQPTPARRIFELIARAGLAEHDVLIDLGSGLGHVSLLAAICTGARCVGIELEAAYVDCAARCANALGLANASFVRQDAREADLSTGTVFYLYTPFTGAMLDEMLARLRREADTREIRIATLGPCTPMVAREPWLRSVDTPKADRLVLFRSRALA
ncbi:class I SAM-dependent methyltransferase [Luteimonas gilva]|uniref:Class I SAM-dependent methyltransferase n=1 Tax=Luteimonas gilva TaxID=2572684 RepID=A0A4V5ZPL7_9GAMM|nr:class I SAM-dependent methyltransferase [Luteimonas gilva]TKR29523.1 class I SAM-dependent methyltransferase [Luteimonas gilva]